MNSMVISHQMREFVKSRKESNSKLLHVGHVTSVILSTISKDAPSSLSRRLAPQKSCT